VVLPEPEGPNNEKEAESNKDFDRENLYYEKMHKACFDARVFSIPENDVSNYFLWRRKDCIRNSIASFAQSKFSSKQLHGLNTSEMLKKMLDSGFDWDKMSWREKEGFYVYRDSFIENDVKYSKWSISGYGEESFWNPEKINELVAHKNGQRTSKI
jgi:tRNA(His) 5'-end guanylyltransferase